MTSLLDSINSSGFVAVASAVSGADGLFDFLTRHPSVTQLNEALANKSISPAEVRKFVQSVLYQFRPGRRFGGDVVLAAVAVGLSSLPGEFADELLRDLSKLRVAEIPLAPRVAKLVLMKRAESIAAVTTRLFHISPGPNPPTMLVLGVRDVASPNNELVACFALGRVDNGDAPLVAMPRSIATTDYKIARHGAA